MRPSRSSTRFDQWFYSLVGHHAMVCALSLLSEWVIVGNFGGIYNKMTNQLANLTAHLQFDMENQHV